MFGHGNSLLNGIQQDRLSNGVAAGTTLITSSALALKFKKNILVQFLIGTITATAVTKCKLQASADGGSTYNDVAGSGVDLTPSTDDNKIVSLELINPNYAWTHIKALVVRGTANCVVDGIVALSAAGKSEPVPVTGIHASSKRLITPDLGTP